MIVDGQPQFADIYSHMADDIRNQNYTTVNLRLSYQILKQLQLFVNLDNITDTHYTINRGYKMPGFTVMGGFKFSISKT